jgi:hypothetical protein
MGRAKSVSWGWGVAVCLYRPARDIPPGMWQWLRGLGTNAIPAAISRYYGALCSPSMAGAQPIGDRHTRIELGVLE